jgi:hypothetical protein
MVEAESGGGAGTTEHPMGQNGETGHRAAGVRLSYTVADDRAGERSGQPRWTGAATRCSWEWSFPNTLHSCRYATTEVSRGGGDRHRSGRL